MADERTSGQALGPNAWLVDEMYERFRDDPGSVSESWREFFADYQSDAEAGAGPGPDVAQPATGRRSGAANGGATPAETAGETPGAASPTTSAADGDAAAERDGAGGPSAARSPAAPPATSTGGARGDGHDAVASSSAPATSTAASTGGPTAGERTAQASSAPPPPGKASSGKAGPSGAAGPSGKAAPGKGGASGTAAPTGPAAGRPPGTATAAASGSAPSGHDGAAPAPLRGASARIVANMEASLAVPTATSFREVPAKLLEVNRKVINGYLGRTRGGKVSFTHLIGFAVVTAINDTTPVMNANYLEVDGKPHVVRHDRVNLGLAVDLEKADGSRTLLVPVIKGADSLDFRGFWGAYEDVIRKVRSNKLGPDDFAGATVTLTNPGTIGTVQSVPRLMPGQGVIVGVGRLDYPAAFSGADPSALAGLGVSKVMTITSTYDHRIIQGAESGLFLKRVSELLMGADGFYDSVFRSLGVPYEAVRWLPDQNPVDREQSMLEKQMHVQTLINAHRVRGHLIADLDPLAWKEPHMHSELDPATYGLTIWDLDREFLTDGLAGTERMPLGDILKVLRDAYCRRIGVEYMHIQEPAEKRWIQEQVEGAPATLEPDVQRHILDRLNAAEAFERFLATKYLGQKRFGIEGAESAIPILDAILEAAAGDALDGAVLGMAHRGRLNVLANIVGKSYRQLFKEFEGYIDPDSTQGSGDVKYHLGQTGTFRSRLGREIPVELAANPSHLEAVDPVVVGIVRARQDRIDQPESFSVLPVLVHGDAAFAGQGVVAETLNLSSIKGYRVGGTIHLIINNPLGFTTPPDAARSSEYCTDVAKMVQAPIFHVNGDDPEACVRVAQLAYAYRQAFHKDVVIDMICYRRHGHNEGDDPSYTQPIMYKRIDARRSVRKLYTESLVKRGDITIEEAEAALDDFGAKLQAALEETRSDAPPGTITAKPPAPAVGVLPHVDTGVARDRLEELYRKLGSVPEGFVVHPKLAKQFETRDKMFAGGEVDWALAEALAFGSLLVEGTPIRLSGQDTRRGTFSQRHSVLVDFDTGAEFAPLAHLAPGQGKVWIYDSLLSEYAALGFEYGYSVIADGTLVCWEAQFGDFVNGAQIVIDQYLVAAEDKWEQRSGLVLLLPHGYEGQGPEHSSARIERFLTLCAEDNLQVCNASTSAQYFHLLRRQMRRDVRKPLVVFTPKSLLRARSARSPIDELTSGSFREVLDDASVADPTGVTRLVLCSGKVAHDALAKRDKDGLTAAAVVRVEQLYPFPRKEIGELLARYESVEEVVWLQEEPDNMGPRAFVAERLRPLLPPGVGYREVARVGSGSPATGSHTIHVQEQQAIVDAAFDGLK
ncbi:MAG: multifunctional oxoglutarate decarboxylase/oxoglutarate dehydrogenase thiamine pyrophosphate-binding subunit/dihydrolipoyllysine-residue succinyltransferase subunit [Actinobacteria bacterium]|nr:multifunctional oxoglutarate decarboxylase/oxoglutarate dehydrogenase thiamine pyrophosphate-binding subunit/dihydrolipoyllysine-residue succinyltransferase subunit [Actinomycetota bacterium]